MGIVLFIAVLVAGLIGVNALLDYLMDSDE